MAAAAWMAPVIADGIIGGTKKKGANAVDNTASLAGRAGNFLFFIPIQVGPASPYARNLRHWMQVILFVQVVICVVRFVVLMDVLGGLWMSALVAVGCYAYSQEMNITYICVWGAGCGICGVFDTVALIVPLLLDVLTLQLLEILVRALVPVSEVLGAAYAWHLYLDYYSTGGGSGQAAMHNFAQNMPDPMGKLVDEVDPTEVNSLAKGIRSKAQTFESQLDAKKFQSNVSKTGEAIAHAVPASASSWLQGFEQDPSQNTASTGKEKKKAGCC